MSWAVTIEMPCVGGKLSIGPKDWRIDRYFPGPDLRYNGEYYVINSSNFLQVCKSLRDSWSKYEAVKIKFEGEKNVELEGFGTSRIFINHSFGNGVSLMRYHGVISSRVAIEGICAEIEAAPAKVEQVRSRLRDI